MIVALADNITLTDLQLRAYEQMSEPKKLVTVEGGHFDPYIKQFPRATAAAVLWFRQHLAWGPLNSADLKLIHSRQATSRPPACLKWWLL